MDVVRKIRIFIGGVLCIVVMLLLFGMPANADETTAPAAPANLLGVPGDARAFLSWSANTEADLAGYDVYRSEVPGELGAKLNPALIPKNKAYFTNTGLANGKTYYYNVVAVDTSGNASAPSSQVAVTPNKPTTVNVSGTLRGTVTWKSNTIYLVTGFTTVDTGTVLNIEPGAMVKFNSGLEFYIKGTVNANGTPNNYIRFTSYRDDRTGGDTNKDGSATSPQPGDWQRLKPLAGSTLNVSRAIIKYAGTGIWYYAPLGHYFDRAYYVNKLSVASCEVSYCGKGIYILGVKEASVKGCAITNNKTFGMMIVNCEKPSFQYNQISNNGTVGVNSLAVEIGSNALPSFKGNTLSGNTQNAVWVWDAAKSPTSVQNQFSSTGASAVLYGTTVYHLYGTTWVSPGTTLTIQPGTVVKGEPGAIVVQGSLVALGTGTRPVVFTSYRDTAYGGSTHYSQTTPLKGDWFGLQFDPGSKGTITGSIITYASKGVNANGATVSITGSGITKNKQGVSNTATSPAVFAENNWWGAANGPYPLGSGDTISYHTDPATGMRVYDVDADPWLTSAPF